MKFSDYTKEKAADEMLAEDVNALRLRNYVSSINKFIEEVDLMHDDVSSLFQTPRNEREVDVEKMRDAVEDVHMNLVFLKKQFMAASASFRANAGGNKMSHTLRQIEKNNKIGP